MIIKIDSNDNALENDYNDIDITGTNVLIAEDTDMNWEIPWLNKKNSCRCCHFIIILISEVYRRRLKLRLTNRGYKNENYC